MSAVILQDEIVHYEVLGRGRPIIFLHGWVGSWRYWIPTMQSVSFKFRTYALDLWGFGDTAKAPANYTLEQQVSLVDMFLGQMGIGKIALIGHGLGAIISLLYAFRFPRQVDRLLVVGLPDGQSSLSPRLYTSQPADLATWLLGRNPESEAARAEAPKADVQAIQRSLDDLQNYPLDKISTEVSVPCLVVNGQNDLAVEAPSNSDVDHLPENVHQIVFDGSGHFPMLDEPSKFQRLLADFLELQPGMSPRQLLVKEEWRRRVR